MDPEAVRATFVIIVLAVASVGAAFAYDAMIGPPASSGRVIDDDQVLTLVDFRSHTLQTTTGTMPFDGSGLVTFEPMPVPVANITSVSATIQVSMQGPSVRDTFSVVITNPQGDEISGEVSRQANPNGYRISEPVVEGWELAVAPSSTHYETDSESEALRWAAENHTDGRHTGLWSSEVSLNPPVTALRSGNVSLSFTFTYYTAQAFAPDPAADSDPEQRGFFDARNAAVVPTLRRMVEASTPFPEPS